MEVIYTDEFGEWFRNLADDDAEAVARKVELLDQMGVTLEFPHSSNVAGTDEPLRELRITSGGDPIRVFYAFDPNRDAVLLLGGNKAGDDRFYERMVPKVETIWQEYLDELE